VELIPALDLLGGRSVRLREGDYDQSLAVGDPMERLEGWLVDGATAVHVVDLEGARAGEPRALPLMARLFARAREVAPDTRIQAAGGLRTEAAVAAVFDAGATAAVLGTAAIEQPELLERCATRWPEGIFVALDLREGRLRGDGWLRALEGDAVPIGARAVDAGAAGILVTDVRRDGGLGGPNMELLGEFRAALPDAWLGAAGGVRSTADLLELQRMGLDGAIVGLALLTGGVDVAAARAALEANQLGTESPTHSAGGPAPASGPEQSGQSIPQRAPA
jgi:phosphoribosylformimino-5-aminoimidazole carboxamide ribotide isomerase